LIAEQFLVSPSKRPPLRVGLLLDGLVLPRCFEQVIDHIQKSNFTKIELLMIRAPANAELVRQTRPKWRFLEHLLSDPKRRKHVGFAIYNRLDEKYFFRANNPLEEIDCTDKLLGIESLNITPIVNGFVDRFAPPDIE
jgi:hypothetical protein